MVAIVAIIARVRETRGGGVSAPLPPAGSPEEGEDPQVDRTAVMRFAPPQGGSLGDAFFARYNFVACENISPLADPPRTPGYARTL